MKRTVGLFVVFATVGLWGCGNDDDDETSAPIQIGAVIPTTGAFSSGGGQVALGYQLAIEAINDAGGVTVGGKKHLLELTQLNDESDAAKTPTLVQQLVDDPDISALLGGFGSGLHAVAVPVADAGKVPYLGVAFALWSIHQQGYDYLFSPFAKSPDHAAVTFELIDSIAAADRPTKIGILKEDTGWGDEQVGFWETEAAAHGFAAADVMVETYTVASGDVSTQVAALQSWGADAVLALPIPPDGVAIINAMVALDYTPAFTLFIRAPDNPAWITSLQDYGDFVMFLPGWHHSLAAPGVDALNTAHEEVVGRPADPLVGPSYATVQILAAAIEAADSTDRDAIRDALASGTFSSILGDVSFNADGTADVIDPILQYQDWDTEIVWPTEHQTAPLVCPAPPFAER